MADRRTTRTDSVYVPGPVPEKLPARRVLHAEGWQLREFVVACLRALLADPAGFLAGLDGHRPERRRSGRPEGSPRGGTAR